MPENNLVGSPVILFGVYLSVILEIYAFTNSSPQTVEINAKSRAPTLMKYVNIASVSSAGVGVVGVILAPKGSKIWPAIGAGSGIIFAHLLYQHAKQTGLSSTAAPTEHQLPAQITEVSPVYRGQALVSTPRGKGNY